MSENDSREAMRPVNPIAGIHPDVMYTAAQVREIFATGKNFARELEDEGFKWAVVPGRTHLKVAMGRQLIDFIFKE